VSKVQDVMKKAAREAYWKCREGGYESLVTYRANFDAVLTSYIAQGNADLGEVSNAMDFFGGLDSARYAHMKDTLHIGWSTGDRAVPQTVNTMYTIAANWIEVKAVDRPGQAMMFVTSRVDAPVTKKTGSKPKDSSDVKKEDQKASGKSKSEKEIKLASIECFNCHQKGHYSNKCTMEKVSGKVTTVEDGDDDAPFHVNATWDNCVFNTRQVSVNAAVDPRVKVQPDWVLLDNQADIASYSQGF
jgi:hypothetical protein